MVFPPDWSGSVSVVEDFDCNVREALDTSEARSTHQPRGLFRFDFTVLAGDKDNQISADMMNACMQFFENLGELPAGCPMWFDAMKLTVAASVSETTLQLDAFENSIFELQPEWVLVWSDYDTWEVFEVSSFNEGANTITTAGNNALGFPAGAYVVPLLFGHIRRATGRSPKDNVSVYGVRFREVFSTIADQSASESTVTTLSTTPGATLSDLITNPDFAYAASLTPLSDLITNASFAYDSAIALLHALGGDASFAYDDSGFVVIYKLSTARKVSVTFSAGSGAGQYGLLSAEHVSVGGPRYNPINEWFIEG